ncbi:hypothetical protein M0R04_05870 [Candidatus Dojkabacteria bacterium]|jgi:hypothetical protein|nr:hypothetical protein [Candidatus Dojkabacteria bacterium]
MSEQVLNVLVIHNTPLKNSVYKKILLETHPFLGGDLYNVKVVKADINFEKYVKYDAFYADKSVEMKVVNNLSYLVGKRVFHTLCLSNKQKLSILINTHLDEVVKNANN